MANANGERRIIKLGQKYINKKCTKIDLAKKRSKRKEGNCFSALLKRQAKLSVSETAKEWGVFDQQQSLIKQFFGGGEGGGTEGTECHVEITFKQSNESIYRILLTTSIHQAKNDQIFRINFSMQNNVLLLSLSSSDLRNILQIGPSTIDTKRREKRAKFIWRYLRYQQKSAVCFDMDSTLIKEESLDEFARWVGKDLSSLTQQAMQGRMGFRQSLLNRLDLLAPTWAQYRQFFAEFVPTLTDGVGKLLRILNSEILRVHFEAEELVCRLRELGIDVFIVTGGFHEIAELVAHRLGIPGSNIFANRILFDISGAYQGIDKSQLTSQSGGSSSVGKAGVCQFLRERHSYKVIVAVGDGSTDLEARQTADLFIGFGGHQIRAKVRLGSDWFVRNFDTLTKYLS